MKKRMFTIIAIALLIVAGCTPAANNNDKQNDNEQNINSEPNNNGNNDNQINDDNDANKETGNDEQESGEITYKINGEVKTVEPDKRHSDNQNYTISVLPEYTFTEEEPGNDVVYLTDNGLIFMRIQLLDQTVDWNDLENNSMEQLKSLGENVTSISVPDTQFYHNTFANEVVIGDEKVAIYLIKNHSVPLKLTLFTNNDSDHTETFLKMAETITAD